MNKIRSWSTSFKRPGSQVKLNTLIVSFTLWFLVCPTLLGILYDLIFVMSKDRLSSQSFFFDFRSLSMGWLSGMFLLHIWGIMCYYGAFSKGFWQNLAINFNENNAQNAPDQNGEGTQDTRRGRNGKAANFVNTMIDVLERWEWEKVDSTVLIRNCLLPIAMELAICINCSFLMFVFVHYVFPIKLVPFFTDLGLYRIVCLRISLFMVITTRLCSSYNSVIHHWFQAAHKAARDDRYLIGEQL